MKYIAVLVPGLVLALAWKDGAGFVALCITSLIILKLWENEQGKKKEN